MTELPHLARCILSGREEGTRIDVIEAREKSASSEFASE
jgi:hypothetical protein